MSNKEAAVQMRGICKRFDIKQANIDVDFDLYRGEIVSLLGENGSGKTTLMNMLAGIYYPDAGQSSDLFARSGCKARHRYGTSAF